MKGIRAIGEMDLIHDVDGHMVRQDGTVVGLVTEAAWGRPIKSSNRALIYQTAARLQGWGCIYFGCLANHFLIAAGNVRLIELSSLCFYSKDNTERFYEEATEVRRVQNKKHCRGATIFIGDEQEFEAIYDDRENRQLVLTSSLRTRPYRQNRAVALFHPYRSRLVTPVGCQKYDETDGSLSTYLQKSRQVP